jgi:predicted transcriptional regulator
MKESNMVTMTLRLPEALVSRVDALVEVLKQDDEWTMRGLDTRANVLREATIRGVKELEQAAAEQANK